MVKRKKLNIRILVLGVFVMALMTLVSARGDIAKDRFHEAREAFVERKKLKSPLSDIDLKTAIEIQDLLMLDVAAEFGSTAGYFQALTPGGRPLLGVLLENMFTSTGATVVASNSADLQLAPAWVLRLGSINSTTVSQASEVDDLASITSELIPAVLIRDDLMGEPNSEAITSQTAVNLGIRYVVMGHPISLSGHGGLQAVSGTLNATLLDSDGVTLSEGDRLTPDGARVSLLIRKIAGGLKARGRQLRANDLIILGSAGPVAVLNDSPRVVGRFEAGAETRKIVLAIRPE
ncbi:MAG: hypothetical protein EVB05_06760 [Candidatus Thioglobus sp.]|nr:MAG: hypothetical protein EVB05_06760 [Candidatus Thioglobus sp.]